MKDLLDKLGIYSAVNYALMDQAFVSAVNFIMGIFVARALGLEGYGIFSMLWFVGLFFISIQLAGIINPMMTTASQISKVKRSLYYGSVISHQIVFSIMSSVGAFAFVNYLGSYFINKNVDTFAIALSVALFFYQNQDFCRRLMFSQDNGKGALINDICSYGFRLFLLIILMDKLDVSGVFFVMAFSAAIGIFISAFQIKGILYSFKWSKRYLYRNWKNSKWLIAAALLQWTSGNYFVVSAGIMLGPVSVGAIKAAQNIIGISHILFQAIENVVPSVASRLYLRNSSGGLVRYLIKVSKYGGMATFLMALIVGLFAHELLEIIYNGEYAGYEYVLYWFGGIYILMFFSLPLGIGLRVLEKTSYRFYAYATMSLFSVSTASHMISVYGITGVMVGIFLSNVILVLMLSIYFYKKIKLSI